MLLFMMCIFSCGTMKIKKQLTLNAVQEFYSRDNTISHITDTLFINSEVKMRHFRHFDIYEICPDCKKDGNYVQFKLSKSELERLIGLPIMLNYDTVTKRTTKERKLTDFVLPLLRHKSSKKDYFLPVIYTDWLVVGIVIIHFKREGRKMVSQTTSTQREVYYFKETYYK